MKLGTASRAYLSSFKLTMGQSWNANVRGSLALGLMGFEMLVYSFWYLVCFWFDLTDSNAKNFTTISMTQNLVNHAIVTYMAFTTLLLMIFAFVMCRYFLVIKSKSVNWYVWQTICIILYQIYCTIFIQFFGENTIVAGLNLSCGVILGLLLLERNIVLLAFFLSVIAFVIISINRKTHWFCFGSVYSAEQPQDYWFWVWSYLYFTIFKVFSTVFVVDWFLKTLIRQQEKIYELSQRDTLTGIYNRRTLYNFLNFIWQNYLSCEYLSVIYLDLDKFKAVNDQHGHSVGDKILIEVCKLINQQLKINNYLNYKFVRMGGEEFIVVLPYTTKKQALELAENLRTCISQHPMIGKADQSFFMTASFGVATLFCCPSPSTQKVSLLSFSDYLKTHLEITPDLPIMMQELINRASNATCMAKSLGRNQVVDGGMISTTCQSTRQVD